MLWWKRSHQRRGGCCRLCDHRQRRDRDWDKDQAWWCLNDATGEMTTVGVADIALHDGDSYAFVYTK